MQDHTFASMHQTILEKDADTFAPGQPVHRHCWDAGICVCCGSGRLSKCMQAKLVKEVMLVYEVSVGVVWHSHSDHFEQS